MSMSKDKSSKTLMESVLDALMFADYPRLTVSGHDGVTILVHYDKKYYNIMLSERI